MDFLPPDSSDEDDEDEKQIKTTQLKQKVTINTNISSAPIIMKYNNNNAMVPGYQPQQELVLLPQQQQTFVQLTHFSTVNSQHLVSTLHERKPPPPKRRKTNINTKNNKVSDNVEDGPWVSYNTGISDDDDNSVTIKALTKAERDAREREAMRAEEMEKQKEAAALKPSSSAMLDESERQEGAEESIFYGEAERDYQGRPWITPPSYIDISKSMDSIECFIPKKVVHVYKGYKKKGANIGVQSIEFFPKYGHLLLSSSMDGTVRVWDTVNDKRCMRSYHGHKEAVRGAHFRPNDGIDFLSFSFDKKIKIWDVETGKCKQTVGNGNIPYSCKYSPTEPHVILAACNDKKIVQYDTRTTEIIQEYDHHFAAVNTLTWYDDGRKFMTCGDDKRVLCWEYGVPTPIKYIAEPDMHTIAAVTSHPNGNYFAGQSLDNKIVLFDTRNKFSMVKKRSFKGHVIAGYACQIGFSSNGKFIMSGDGRGQIWFWDFNSGKILRKLQSHKNSPCIGAVWHPVEASTVATCSWNGQICLWK
jgi:pre-mRNA-processing factor 17